MLGDGELVHGTSEGEMVSFKDNDLKIWEFNEISTQYEIGTRAFRKVQDVTGQETVRTARDVSCPYLAVALRSSHPHPCYLRISMTELILLLRVANYGSIKHGDVPHDKKCCVKRTKLCANIDIDR